MAPPAAPSNLTATPITASRIDLTWQDNSNNETGFQLERSTTGVGGWSLINSPAANATTYSDTSLPGSTEVYYRIRAVNGDGNSAYSNIVEAIKLFVGRAPITPRLYLLQPDVVLAARVNMAGATYPVDYVDVDGVTTGSVGAATAGLTLLLGSAAGLDDYGRQRMRLDGAGARLYVGRSSRGTHDGELTVVDNAYVTVLNDRRVWAKIPYIDSMGIIYKDSDLEVDDRTTEPPPVANTGVGQAGTIDPDTSVITCFFDGQRSFAVADAATITDYLWDIADGTLVGAAALDEDTTVATFPPGFRYVSLTVTDSNGKTHTAYAPVFARDPDDDESFDGFLVESERITEAGKQVTIRILQDMPRATYPDGTLAMIWQEEPAGRPMLACGWLDSENATIGAGRFGLLRDTTLTILDVAGRLDILPGFPQSIADDATRDTELLPDITWSYMTTPNLDKYLHYLLHWHSTALEVADFVWSDTGDEYEFLLLSSDGDSLWNQVDRRARAFVPDRVLTHDLTLGILVIPDPMLQDVADRTATVQRTILEVDWSDLRYTYQRAPRVHWTRASAILAGDTEPIGTVFSIAPGDTPGQGVGEVVQGEQLALSQAALNAATGHRYARVNNRLGLLTLTVVQNDGGGTPAIPWAEIRPALKEWVTLTVSAATAAQRGLTFTTARCLPREVTVRRDHRKTGTLRTVTLTLEVETIGQPGHTVVKPDVPAVGDTPPWIPPTIPPPDFGLIDGQELVAGIGLTELYRTADFQTVSGSGGPTWTAHALTTEDILSWVVDPFSPGYLTGTGAVNGWVVTGTDIYRVTDIFGTVGCTSIHTFAVPLAGSTEWRTIQASFGTYFLEGLNPWLMVVSHYADSAGHTGTWALRSVDGGATWETEEEISAHYDDGASTDTRPVAVYLSPKTPGLAYATAFITTDDPPQASGFVSTDWGETWSQMVSDFVENPAEPLPRWALWHLDPVASGLEVKNLGGSFSAMARAEEDGLVAGTTETEFYVILAPPPDTARVLINCTYSSVREMNGGSSSTSGIIGSIGDGTNQTHTDDLSYTQPGTPDGTSAGSFMVEWTKSGVADWTVNANSIISAPPGSLSGARIRVQAVANASGTLPYALYQASLRCTVAEIELEGGYTYTPAPAAGTVDPNHRLAGDMHVPWIDNASEGLIYHGYADVSTVRQFRLKRVNVDDTIDDISPEDTGVLFGVNHYGFAIRAYDSDRAFMLAGVTGNDVSAATSGDKQAVYISDDNGDTWVEVVAPATGTEPYGAAFAGDNELVLYLWGPAGYMGYSSNFGVAVDSRAGNLGALSAEPLCGIAGGPTP